MGPLRFFATRLTRVGSQDLAKVEALSQSKRANQKMWDSD